MKILAIADELIPAGYIRAGFAEYSELAEGLEIRTWYHRSVRDLQRDNLKIERMGPASVDVPRGLFDGVEEFDVLVTQFCPVPAHVIARARKLRVIGVMRGGTENVDLASMKTHNIKLINTPGRNAEAVAEFTVGILLAELRNIARSQADLREGVWGRDFPNVESIPEIEGKTVGVVGFGQVGRRVARFLGAMGARICVFDPLLDDADGVELCPDILTLASRCDVLTVHARLSSDTYHLISEDVIAALRPNAVLVNTARSGLVDEEALLDALEGARIAGAAIDTFDEEPLPADSRFLMLPNVTITAHLAGSTIDAFKKTPRLLADRLSCCIKEF